MPLLYVPTIYVLTLCVMALLGVLTLFAWLQNRAIVALAWWSGAVILMAVALALLCLRGAIPNVLSLDLAYVVLFVSAGLMLEGTRRFEGRDGNLAVLLAGAAVWIAFCQVPALYDSVTARTILISATIGLYSLGCALAIWRGRAEPLISRWPLIVLLGLGGALFLVRIPLAVVYPLAQATINSVDALQSTWYAVLSTSSLLFIVAVYFLFLALAKERTELAHKLAAMTDPLTGILNRRAFLQRAERRLGEAEGLAYLIFDLDCFKRINDNHGHAAGDSALRLFADTLRAQLRSSDVAGRLGGEEFAALLSDAGSAPEAAERIRGAFALHGQTVEGAPVEATVSAGLAFAVPGDTIATLAERADKALYRAKALGRNRVEVATESPPLAPALPASAPGVSAHDLSRPATPAEIRPVASASSTSAAISRDTNSATKTIRYATSMRL